jgi:hypothetical protein
MVQNTPPTAGPTGKTIIRTQDEGGSIALSAVHGPTGWAGFTLVSEEHPPAEMPGDEGGAQPQAIVRFAGPAETWEGALALLDRFVWQVLTPDFVHPDFRQATLAAVRERAADKDDPCAEFVEEWLPKWESTCSTSEDV